MCYEERLFRSWFTKKTQKRERDITALERSRGVEPSSHPAPSPETTHPSEAQRKLEERELEDIV
jgi:hypothetical protein